MPTTSPDGIYFADGATAMSAESISAAEATSVQDALDDLVHANRQLQAYDWANSAARTAQTGMTEGALGYQRDTDVYYTYTGFAWILLVTPGGLVPIIPTVAGTGVSVNAAGLVTFTAATAANITAFSSSSYTNYLCKFRVTSRSLAGQIQIRLRLGGTDNTGSVYDRQNNIASGATSTASTASAQTIWDNMAGGNRSFQRGDISFYAPNVASPTFIDATISDNDATANFSRIGYSGWHRDSTAFDGFSLISSTGTITGTLKVYGYN